MERKAQSNWSIIKIRKVGSKLILRKYDPLVNQYVIFTESKLASGKKK